MKILETNFTRSGWHFERLFRDGNIAIYFKTLNGADRASSYEVIRVRSHDGYEIAGAKIPAGESFPSSEMWGTHGFTFTDYNSALKRAYEMIASDKQKSERKQDQPA